MNTKLIIPAKYKPLLNLRETEKSIRHIKEFFQTSLAVELNLFRVTAPLFVPSGTGINDDLNGIEQPVSFSVRALNNKQVEIVQSLAKWKRLMLADYKLRRGEGLYTDMNALRPDEDLDNLHSIYVDQWDWEGVISRQDRNLSFLKLTVRRIYDVIRRTEWYIHQQYEKIKPILPEDITFIHSEELLERFPHLPPHERELEICREYGAVFIIGIGSTLQDGQPHDGRAPDYDDWSTINDNGYRGLNGDIIIYYPVLDCAYELSSMGIRVDATALQRQLDISGKTDRADLYFHKRLLNNELPLSIGGGIGQSRLCMFYLRKAHIGEIQASLWPDKMVHQCRKNNVLLL